MASAPTTCSNSECTFNQDGRCAETDDAETCPFRNKRPLILDTADDEADVAEDDADATETAPPEVLDDDAFKGNLVELASGERLSIEQCSAVLAEAPARVVSFVAPREAGKTSLIAGLYELFLDGRQSDVLFRGSRTIPGFERLCHLSRAASGRTTADMERTRRAHGLGYFHLDLVTRGERIGLLLGDRPGENFVTAAASLGQARNLTEIAAASTLAYLVDGRVLAEPTTKSVPGSVAVTILDAIVEAGLPDARPALALILTKTDLVARGETAASFARFDGIVAQLGARYSQHFSTIRGYRTAASPEVPNDAYPRGMGLAELLADLLADPRPPLSLVRGTRPATRRFEALGARGGGAA